MTPADFPPPRRRGQNLHILLILVLAVIVGLLAVLASRQPPGLAIPFSSVMTEGMVEQVCQAIRAVLRTLPKS